MIKYILFIFFITSCCHHKERNMTVFQINGKGWDEHNTHIRVDSVTETTPTSATIWIDGRKTNIYAEKIMVSE